MTKILEQIIATPLGDGWAVECSSCGPISLTDDSHVDQISSAHLQTHQGV